MTPGASGRAGRRVFDAVAVTVLAALSTGFVLELTFAVDNPDELPWYRVVSLSYVVAGVLIYLVVSRAVIRRDPRQPVGWLLTALMLGGAASVLANGYTAWELEASAWVNWVAWPLRASMWPALAVAFTLFPNGRPLPGWRWLTWTCIGTGAAGVLVAAFAPWPFPPYPNDTYVAENPLAVDALAGAPAAVEALGPLLVLAALSSLFVRFRRAEGLERDQIKVIGAAALLILLAALSAAGAAVTGDVDSTDDLAVSFVVGDGIFSLMLAGLAVAMGVGIVRYRLYEIDRLISRTLTASVLVVGLGGAYGVTVAAASTVFTRDGSSVVASVAIAALVAISFGPLHRRVHRWVERRVFGRAAGSHEVITDLTRDLADAPVGHAVLEHVAATARDVTGAGKARAAVVLSDGREIAVTSGDSRAGWDRVLPVHDGERIGEVAVTAGDHRRRDRRLLEQVVGVATPAMASVRLDAELDAVHAAIQERNREIAASRRRLVDAAEHERAGVRTGVRERVDPDLDALRGAVAALRAMVGDDRSRVVDRCGELVGVATRIVREIRSVSRGVLPPVLTDHGLVAAVRAELRRRPIGGEVHLAPGAVRFDPRVEAAAFLCCRAFLEDATAASARSVTITIDADPARLRMIARHDGAPPPDGDLGAALRIERDRVGASGGELSSTEAGGVEIHAWIPLRPSGALGEIVDRERPDQPISASTTRTA